MKQQFPILSSLKIPAASILLSVSASLTALSSPYTQSQALFVLFSPTGLFLSSMSSSFVRAVACVRVSFLLKAG